jgi:hypothetical protein
MKISTDDTHTCKLSGNASRFCSHTTTEMTDAAVAQHDETSRLLSQSEDISYGATNSTANPEYLEEPAPPVEVKDASYLAYVRNHFTLI